MHINGASKKKKLEWNLQNICCENISVEFSRTK